MPNTLDQMSSMFIPGFNGNGLLGGPMSTIFGTPDMGGIQSTTNAQFDLAQYLANQYKGQNSVLQPMFMDQLQSYRDLIMGRPSAAGDARMSGLSTGINNQFDQSRDRIANMYHGFGKSGDPWAAKLLGLNEVGRAGAMTGAHNSIVNNASDNFSNLLSGGLGRNQNLLTASGNFYGGAAGGYHNLAQASMVPTQTALGFFQPMGQGIGSYLGAGGAGGSGGVGSLFGGGAAGGSAAGTAGGIGAGGIDATTAAGAVALA